MPSFRYDRMFETSYTPSFDRLARPFFQALSGSHLGKFSGSNQQGFLPPVKRKALTFETRFCRLESENKNRN